MHADGRGAGRPSRARRGPHIGSVGEDVGGAASTGALLGSALGPEGTAIGGAIGAAGAAIVDAADWVGGIFKGGPFKTEDQYNDLRRQCRESGGQPTAGVAPDNYGGCTYPDGRVSGGDNPRPDFWNGKRMTGSDGSASLPAGMCPGPFGIPIPCNLLPAAPAPPKPVIHASMIKRPPPVKPVVHAALIKRGAPLLPNIDASRAAPPPPETVLDGLKGPIIVTSVVAVGAIGAGAWWLLGRTRRANPKRKRARR